MPKQKSKRKVVRRKVGGNAEELGRMLAMHSLKAGKGRAKRPQQMDMSQMGAGFFGDVWKGIKKGAKAVGNAFNDSLKQTKVISTLASALPGPLGMVAGQTADNLGYGRKLGRGVSMAMVPANFYSYGNGNFRA